MGGSEEVKHLSFGELKMTIGCKITQLVLSSAWAGTALGRSICPWGCGAAMASTSLAHLGGILL